MKYLIYLFIFTSILFPSDLIKWINNREELINKNSYKLEFEYLINKKKDSFDKNILRESEFLSINKDSSIIKFENRAILCFNDRWETIDLQSKQKIIESNDVEFDDLKIKLRSIFTDKNFKIIKVSKSKYLLSLNDYYINMNIIYNEDSNYISEIYFHQAPYWIYIKNLTITSIDTAPYNYYKQSDSYEVFDFR